MSTLASATPRLSNCVFGATLVVSWSFFEIARAHPRNNSGDAPRLTARTDLRARAGNRSRSTCPASGAANKCVTLIVERGVLRTESFVSRIGQRGIR